MMMMMMMMMILMMMMMMNLDIYMAGIAAMAAVAPLS